MPKAKINKTVEKRNVDGRYEFGHQMMVVYLVTADMGREIVDAADDVDRAL